MTDQPKRDASRPSGSAKLGEVDTRSSRAEESDAAETAATPHAERAERVGGQGAGGASGEVAGARKDQVAR